MIHWFRYREKYLRSTPRLEGSFNVRETTEHRNTMRKELPVATLPGTNSFQIRPLNNPFEIPWNMAAFGHLQPEITVTESTISPTRIHHEISVAVGQCVTKIRGWTISLCMSISIRRSTIDENCTVGCKKNPRIFLVTVLNQHLTQIVLKKLLTLNVYIRSNKEKVLKKLLTWN